MVFSKGLFDKNVFFAMEFEIPGIYPKRKKDAMSRHHRLIASLFV